MNEFIQPDKVYQVPYPGGEFNLSPAHDFLNRFEPVGAWILKYWDSDNRSMHNVYIQDEAAHYLIENCEIEVIYRQHMRAEEHEQLIEWKASMLSDEDFGFEET